MGLLFLYSDIQSKLALIGMGLKRDEGMVIESDGGDVLAMFALGVHIS